MIAKDLKFLSTVELFSDLGSQELDELSKDFTVENYAAGTDIIKSGQEVFKFFILVSGKAMVVKSKKGNNIFPINNFFISGDYFGEISLFTGRPSPVTVIAEEDSIVLTMSGEQFTQMLVRWPNLYERFIYRLARLLNHIDDHLWETRHRQFLRESLQLKKLQQKFYGLWGDARRTRQAEKNIAQLADSKSHLLLVGERGTGRQMMAWYIHKQQFGEAAPFVVVDAHHFDQQWEEVMFKTRQHDGSLKLIKGASMLDIADGGTLFIKEINLIPPRTQQKLAETLKAGEINCRVIGCLIGEPETLLQSISKELRECFAEKFNIQPLRERKRDIPVIAQGVVDKLAAQYNRQPLNFSKEAISFLLAHDYCQGNVTELIRVTEQAFHLADSDEISIEHLFFGSVEENREKTTNLLSRNWVKSLVTKGVLLWIKRLITALFLILIALFVIDREYKTITIIFTVAWSLWWPLLTVLSPVFGRVWCTICPFSGAMEWMQKIIHLDKPVPEFLKKYDYLLITFLFFTGFWFEEITEMRHNPVITGILVVGVVISASIIGMVFTRRTWCRHICPIGHFIGVASISSMLEVRSNTAVCLNKCTSYECYRGDKSKGLAGCPASRYLPFVDNNLDCILCMQCARICPNDAVELNLRIPAREVWSLSRINQGFVLFVAAALAALGPIFYFRTAGLGMDNWSIWYTASYWGAIIAAVALTWLITRPFKTEIPSKRIKLMFALIPLVFAGYMVYQFRFIPGVDSLLLGLGWKTAEGTASYYISALVFGQLLATIWGIAVSAFTITKVLRQESVACSSKHASN